MNIGTCVHLLKCSGDNYKDTQGLQMHEVSKSI